MRLVLTALVALVFAVDVDAGGRRSRRYQQQWQPVQTVQPVAAVDVSALKGCEDALEEVNAQRIKRGMKPLTRDPILTQAALACAKQRAARGIHGHLPESDFHYLPSGGQATAAGCAALTPDWGFQACCWDDPGYTVAGAAWIMGPDGRRYNHIFVR